MNMKIKKVPEECPFCHDTPSIVKEPLWYEGHGYHGHHLYYVACKNETCHVQPRTKAYNDIYDMTEQECVDKSIEDWNTR
jgi:hypothetical protein